ncbi:MAG: hypothetical protein KIS88_01025 [Anaerolineales bacterium]|nr:hypothetical protein [Anaerolineales bacterium]
MQKIASIVLQANQALTQNNLPLVKQLIDAAEQEFSLAQLTPEMIHHRGNLGGVMIDFGSWTNQISFVQRGISYLEEYVSHQETDEFSVMHHYNLANGYSALNKFIRQESFKAGKISSEHIREKELYRRAISISKTKRINEYERRNLPDLYTNYGNTLDAIGRPIESLEAFDSALRLDPRKTEALSNKAQVLQNLAFPAIGHTHLFMLEAERLHKLALSTKPYPLLEEFIRKHLREIDNFFVLHSENVGPEKVRNTKSQSKFEKYLRDFCLKNKLYLSPTSFVGVDGKQVLGDPMFITYMWAKLGDRTKFNKYATFLNQIKQDYVFSRYLLVQSTYRSKYTEAIDKEVDYYYPLDYSVHSSYAQMLKVAFRLAVDTLDKIAAFVHDYCEVTSVPHNKVNFRNIWSSREDPQQLRPELAAKSNLLLHGLLDLALDLKENGEFDFVYKRRNVLTHRFLSLHTESIRQNEGANIPKLLHSSFFQETVQVMKITRAAVIYLILFVDLEERKHQPQGPSIPTYFLKVDRVFRHVPDFGE